LLFQTHRGATRQGFLREAAGVLLEFSGCDIIEIRIDDQGRFHRCRAFLKDGGATLFDCREQTAAETAPPDGLSTHPATEQILQAVLAGRFAAAAPFVTRSGSFWTGDTARPILLRPTEDGNPASRTVVIGGEFQSVALAPFPVTERASGVLYLGSRRREFFSKEDVLFYEIAAVTLGVAIAHQGAQWALRERVKELTCLYSIAQATQRPDRPVEELLSEVVQLLPPGWQYPEIASACIVLGSKTFVTANHADSPYRQSADIITNGQRRGSVDVFYSESRPVLDEGPFLKEERSLINAIAETIGVTLSFQAAQLALRERVKELTCLQEIAKVAQRADSSLDEILSQAAALLPPGWLYPELARARILLDGKEYAAAGFVPRADMLSSAIVVNGRPRGSIEIAYAGDMPAIDEGPFLREERHLLDEVARQIGNIIVRREAEEEKARLQQQLRHADRLATIGQLAAGAAHELNEPLGSILGFAELARDQQRLPKQVRADLQKIVEAALHAREVIKKLMLFARQMPTQRAPIDLNEQVCKGLLFLESRCAQENIDIVRELDEDLPRISGDAAQLHQVLVNLVVNAIHSMPGGGTLTIRTLIEERDVLLVVSDTGTGMSEDVLKQIFMPFFTTKQVGQGTGLGLSVVHGIVSAHGGAIRVESAVGSGSRFEVRLPRETAALHTE